MAGVLILPTRLVFDPITQLPLPGALLDVFAFGTLTRLDLWSESTLTSSLPNPVEASGTGILPVVHLENAGMVSVRYQRPDESVFDADDAPVVGFGEEAAPAPAVVIPTGAIVPFDTTDAVTGFVRINGRTIGSAASGATERANADAQALYEWKWTRQDNSKAPVAGGRGTSAAADFEANKVMTMFSPEGHALAVSDDMGAGARSIIPAGFVTVGTAATIGSKFGTMNRTFLRANLPSENLSLSNLTISVSNGSNLLQSSATLNIQNGSGSGLSDLRREGSNVSVTASPGGTLPLGGSGTSFGIAQPSFTIGLFQKL